jgi:hypothetical protein
MTWSARAGLSALIAVIVGMGLGMLAPAEAALAATFTVTRTDNADDGACTPADCSLHEAVNAANALDAASGPHTIVLQSGATYTVSPILTGNASGHGDLDITGNVRILAPGGASATMQGAGSPDAPLSYPVIKILSGGTLYLNGLTIQNGNAGGIVNAGTLTAVSTTIAHNEGTLIPVVGLTNDGGTVSLISSLVDNNGGVASHGRGIANDHGSMSIINSTISNNGRGNGGGISNGSAGTITITHSSIVNNTAFKDCSSCGFGGGINNLGTLTINESLIDGNSAGVVGGGIFSQGTLTLTNSTVSNNSTTGGSAIPPSGGGGIAGGATIVNSSVIGNTAAGGNGGGISGTVTLVNSTVAGNAANANVNGGGSGNGIYGALTSKNSIVMDACDGGTVTPQGVNLGVCTGFTNHDPLLGTLQDNGGFTTTRLPSSGGPAVTEASPSGCTDANGDPLLRDQRGVPRPSGGPCHVGAIQIASGGPVTTPIQDQFTLEDTTAGPIAFRIADSDTPLASATLSIVSATSNNQPLVPNSGIGTGGSGGNRTVTITPAANAFGNATITLGVSDGSTTVTPSFGLTVAPVADTPGLSSTVPALEDTMTAVGAITVTRNPADGAEVGFFQVTNITNGSLFLNDGTTAVAEGSFVAFGPSGSTGLRFKASADFNGAAGFSVQASTTSTNGGLGGGLATTAITVTPVNDPPSFTPGPNITVPASSAPFNSPWATSIRPGPANEASQAVVFQVTANTNSALFSVQPAVAPDGTLTFAANPQANGVATITLVLQDNGGTATGGVDTSSPQTFSITVVGPTAACTPLPRVNVMTAVTALGQLTVNIASTTQPGTTSNFLQRIRFMQLDNATVNTRDAANQRTPFVLELPEHPTNAGFQVHWIAPGAFTVHIVVETDCGSWPTFVGAGPGAF